MKKIFLALLLLVSVIAPQKISASWSDYVIVLDPGHGGDDPGAVYNGSSVDNYTEAWLVLQCASSVYNTLSNLGADVYMTRYYNDFSGEVGLSTRRSYCYTYGSDVFVSFHLNAANASAHGTETWYYYDGSYNLANCIQSGLMDKFATVDGVGGYERINRGIKNNGWTVITAGEYYPAVLTEGLFVDCYSDWQLIQDTSSVGFNAWVDGHLKGIYDYLSYYGYYSVSEPPYNGSGSSSVAQTPYISVSSNNITLTCDAGQTATAEVEIDGAMLNSWTTVTLTDKCKGIFSVDKSGLNVSGDTHTFDPEKPTIKITFSPDKVGTWSGDNNGDGYEDYVITIASVDTDGNPVYQWITLNGVGTTPPLAFEEGWVISENRNNLTAQGWDASKIRNMDVYNGKIYTVYNQSVIRVLDAHTGKFLYDLSNEGVEGGIINLCDVRGFDGKIIASNLGGIDGTGNTHDLRLYVWDNPYDPTKAPEVTVISYETLAANNISRIGDYIGLGGDWNKTAGSRIIFAYDNYGKVSNGGAHIIEFPVANNAIGTTPSKIIEVTADGSIMRAGSSIRVYPTGYGYMIDGTLCSATKLSPAGVRLDYMDGGYKSWSNTYRQFVYDGVTYGLMLDYNDLTGDSKYNYTGGYMRLMQIADEKYTTTFRAPKDLALYPSETLASTRANLNCTGNIVINQDGDNYIEAWVLSTNQGLAYYSLGSVPAVPAPSFIISDSEVELSALPGESVSADITISGCDLVADAKVAIVNDNAGVFSISQNTIAISAPTATISIVYNPSESGEHTASLKISTTGANDVIVPLTGICENIVAYDNFELSQDWAHTSNHITPSSAGRGWSTGFDGKIFFNNDASPALCYWDKDGRHTLATSVVGTAITSDNAQNIILSNGLWGTSATSFKVLPAGSTTWTNLTVTLPSGVNAAATKYLGKAIGDIMSEEGGAMFIIPSGNKYVAKIVIKNGVQVSATAINVSSVLTADAETFATPLTNDINSNLIAVRKRSENHFYHNLNGSFEALEDNGITTTQGGTIFSLCGKLFSVEPTGIYSDAFQIVDIENNTIVATHDEKYSSDICPNPNCITAEVVSATEVKLYQYLPGEVASQYTFKAKMHADVAEIAVADMTIRTAGETLIVEGADVASINVFTLTGALVCSSNSNEANLGNLQAGVYIVKVVDINGNILTEKMVYNK